MSARRLAEMIESYLESDDDATNGGSGSAATTALDVDTRSQIRALSQTCDQLKQDNASLKKDLAGLKSNLQMSMMLPLLLNQKLQVVSDSGFHLTVGEKIEFESGDLLSALLPMLMMGGFGDGGGNGGGGMEGSNMVMMALALSGRL